MGDTLNFCDSQNTSYNNRVQMTNLHLPKRKTTLLLYITDILFNLYVSINTLQKNMGSYFYLNIYY